MTIRLQGIGWHEAKPARQIKPGDVLVWNYGSKSSVLRIVKETPAQIIIRERYHESGREYNRRLGKDRLVAIQ